MALDSFAVAPQPAPSAGEGDAVWPTIFSNENLALPDWLGADMRARHEAGVAKYGTPLRVWNGRNPVVDAYQEALDLLVYAQQARARLGALSLHERGRGVPSSILSARLTLDVVFHQALQAARWLGELARIDTVPSQPPKVTR